MQLAASDFHLVGHGIMRTGSSETRTLKRFPMEERFLSQGGSIRPKAPRRRDELIHLPLARAVTVPIRAFEWRGRLRTLGASCVSMAVNLAQSI